MSALVRLCSVTKRFPGVLALDQVSFEIAQGTCHAVMGENGAGKSTLGKILAGIYQPDGGHVEVGGTACRFRSPLDARRAGVGIVHQELAYCPNLAVAENISLGSLPRRGRMLDRTALNRTAVQYLAEVGADCDPSDEMGSLPTAQVQLVQIAAALAMDARILVMDEPTSSLSRADAVRLHSVIRKLCAAGHTVLYVSHRMEECLKLCESVTVLRDGRHVATKPIRETSEDELVQLMVGRPLSSYLPDGRAPEPGREVLRVGGLSSAGQFEDVSFSLRAGEVLGVAGLIGAGRSEIARTLFGLERPSSGTVTVDGETVVIGSPLQAMERGLGFVPEDRKKQGLVAGMSCRENVTLASLGRLNAWGFVRQAEELRIVSDCFERLSVRAAGFDVAVGSLSGGNQQKLVLAKWLARNSQILILDEPTRGIDIAAKSEIHHLILELASRGRAILLISSELPELLALSTRVIVLRKGRVAGALEREEANEQRIMAMMAGPARAEGAVSE